MYACMYSIASPKGHTCSIHALSKILMRIYIILQTHFNPQYTKSTPKSKSHQLYVLVRIS